LLLGTDPNLSENINLCLLGITAHPLLVVTSHHYDMGDDIGTPQRASGDSAVETGFCHTQN
jgi:hypothetical protein